MKIAMRRECCEVVRDQKAGLSTAVRLDATATAKVQNRDWCGEGIGPDLSIRIP